MIILKVFTVLYFLL